LPQGVCALSVPIANRSTSPPRAIPDGPCGRLRRSVPSWLRAGPAAPLCLKLGRGDPPVAGWPPQSLCSRTRSVRAAGGRLTVWGLVDPPLAGRHRTARRARVRVIGHARALREECDESDQEHDDLTTNLAPNDVEHAVAESQHVGARCSQSRRPAQLRILPRGRRCSLPRGGSSPGVLAFDPYDQDRCVEHLPDHGRWR
jgi:hypothetical protein